MNRLTLEAGNSWLAHLRDHCFLEMAVVGNLEGCDIPDKVASYFGSLGVHPGTIANTADAAHEDKGHPVVGVGAVSEERAAAALTFQGPRLTDLPNYCGMQLVSRILQYRLYKEVREKRGLVYFAGVHGRTRNRCRWP